MALPLYEIKKTCGQWQLENGFIDISFEKADKNPVCHIIHRLVRASWEKDILIIDDFENIELNQEQQHFLNMLRKKHNLVLNRLPGGQYFLSPEIDHQVLFDDKINFFSWKD